MPILVTRHGRGEQFTHGPVVICDQCGDEIEDGNRGMCHFDMPTEVVPSAIYFTHKGDCDRKWVAAHPADRPAWEELSRLVVYLKDRLHIDIDEIGRIIERTVGSVGSDPSAGLVLHLSATTVKPGQVITRTVTGGGSLPGGSLPDFNTASAMQLQQCINGSWQTIYYLFLDQTDPQSRAGSAGLPITLQGLSFSAFKARIPPVPAGTYRISQALSTPKGRATVYAIMTVTTS